MGPDGRALRSGHQLSSLFFPDPGPCPVDDAPHHTCNGGGHGIAIVQLPQRDAAAAAAAAACAPAVPHTPLQADIVQATLPAGAFTTGTYRRRKKPAG